MQIRPTAPTAGRCITTIHVKQNAKMSQQPFRSAPDQVLNPPAASTPPLAALPTDISALRQAIVPALRTPGLPLPAASTLPRIALPAGTGPAAAEPDPRNVLVVVPTANASKAALIRDHLLGLAERERWRRRRRLPPAGVRIVDFVTVPADSGVGAQPYDGAGPLGAVNRVVGAVRRLLAADDDDAATAAAQGIRGRIVEKGVGTLLVGSVENFIQRDVPVPGDDDDERVRERWRGWQLRQLRRGKEEEEEVVEEEGEEDEEHEGSDWEDAWPDWTEGGRKEGQRLPVDYGVVVFCRIDLKTGTWEWTHCISKGVTVPSEYLALAETFGFEDEQGCYGRATVGEQLEKWVSGLDGADWHRDLVGKSRYKILKEAMTKLRVPWPQVGGSSNADPATIKTQTETKATN